jgi:hypothetical protein
MKLRIVRGLLVVCALALASSSRAETWSIGPSIGVEVMGSGGFAVAVFGMPAGPDVFAPTVTPGLRIGATTESGHHQGFLDTSVQLVAGTGGTYYRSAATLNYLYAFRSGSSPYVTFGAGLSNFGFDGAGESFTLYGLGLGVRSRLGHGHGALRVELRYDHGQAQQYRGDALHTIGLRIGFDLDLD